MEEFCILHLDEIFESHDGCRYCQNASKIGRLRSPKIARYFTRGLPMDLESVWLSIKKIASLRNS